MTNNDCFLVTELINVDFEVDWSQEDILTFESALRQYGKRFHRIAERVIYSFLELYIDIYRSVCVCVDNIPSVTYNIETNNSASECFCGDGG